MSPGPIMLDLAGSELTAEDRALLRHPAVCGVILFARNYTAPEQLSALTTAIRALREPAPLIAVDQEGGRVQRFRDGLTRLPPAGALAAYHADDLPSAGAAARHIGWLMAAELRALGVDFSFAPVLDLDRGNNQAIGDRAFARPPAAVSALARAWCEGVHHAGMATVGKHFPGHGGVAADSHRELPVDRRGLDDLLDADLRPFAELIAAGALDAVMPAHVCYPAFDAHPAGFSARWLGEVLRGRLGFTGAIVSDDLGMAAAGVAGDAVARAEAALAAGCDLLLVCNDRAAAGTVAEALATRPDTAASAARRQRLRPRTGPVPDLAGLRELPEWQLAARLADSLCAAGLVAHVSSDPTDPEGRA